MRDDAANLASKFCFSIMGYLMIVSEKLQIRSSKTKPLLKYVSAANAIKLPLKYGNAFWSAITIFISVEFFESATSQSKFRLASLLLCDRSKHSEYRNRLFLPYFVIPSCL